MALRVLIAFATPVRRPAPLPRREARSLIGRAVRATLGRLGHSRAEVSVALLGDEAIADMNQRFLGHEGPIDVISFALYDAGEAPVGDVYIGWDQALRQAALHEVPPAEEIARLAIHGTLHVLGFDHPTEGERERSEMWRVQEEILRKVLQP